MENRARTVAEAFISLYLRHIFNTTFSPKEIELPGDVHHTFDFVSADERIVAELHVFVTPTKRRRLTAAQISDLASKVFLLSGVEVAKRRMLILTDTAAFTAFTATKYASMGAAKGVEIHCIVVRQGGKRRRQALLFSEYAKGRRAVGPELRVERILSFGPPLPPYDNWPKPRPDQKPKGEPEGG